LSVGLILGYEWQDKKEKQALIEIYSNLLKKYNFNKVKKIPGHNFLVLEKK